MGFVDIDLSGAVLLKQVAPLTATDQPGLFELRVPADLAHGSYHLVANRSVPVAVATARVRLLLETDKGIYQPGQAVLVRAVAVDSRLQPATVRITELAVERDRSANGVVI